MNTARSALSSIFQSTNFILFGKQPLIQRALKGMFKEIPSLPRYTVTFDVVTFDVKPVFECIKEIDFLGNTSLEKHTKNLAAIVSLLSGQRLQTIFFT